MLIARLKVKLGRHGVRSTFARVRKQMHQDAEQAKWSFIFDQGEHGHNYWRAK